MVPEGNSSSCGGRVVTALIPVALLLFIEHTRFAPGVVFLPLCGLALARQLVRGNWHVPAFTGTAALLVLMALEQWTRVSLGVGALADGLGILQVFQRVLVPCALTGFVLVTALVGLSKDSDDWLASLLLGIAVSIIGIMLYNSQQGWAHQGFFSYETV